MRGTRTIAEVAVDAHLGEHRAERVRSRTVFSSSPGAWSPRAVRAASRLPPARCARATRLPSRPSSRSCRAAPACTRFDGRADARRGHRAARHRRLRQRRVAELEAHPLDRHAERVGRDLRHDRVRAGADVLRAGCTSARAVGQQRARAPTPPGGAPDRSRSPCPSRPAVAVAHRARRRRCAATSRTARAASR